MFSEKNKEELQKDIDNIKSGDELDYYIDNAYCNFPFFLKSLTRHNSSSYTYFGDVQRDIYYISDNMRDDFGFESNLVINFLEKWRDRIYGKKWLKAYDDDRAMMMETKSEIHDMHYQVKDKDGKVFWIRCCGDMEWDKDHTKPLFFAGRVSKQSNIFIVDPVTNFPSSDTLQRYLTERLVTDTSFWTIGFCLNNVSKINTLYGNNFADCMIKDISQALNDELGNEMTFYRLPGLRSLAVPDQEIDKDIVVMKIREIIEAKYKHYGLVIDVPVSFAAMRFPQENWSVSEFQENMVALLKLSQKEKQSSCIVNSDENINKINAISNMSMIMTKNVLNNMENFRAVVQPVVSTVTGKIVAGETLMRWTFHNQEISPVDFIPILEKDRMIQVAGRWIFEEAVSICSHVVSEIKDFYLTVNVSLQQLYDEEFIPFISTTLDKYRLDGKHIVLEMTESCMDSEPGKIMELVAECNKKGIRLAIDDFGTGYSSLRVLMKYPTNIIKIDRSLLLEMEESDEKHSFVTSLVQACHNFGKKIVVEGVETEKQRNLVKESKGDMIQGFYFYKPLELDSLYKEIKK